MKPIAVAPILRLPYARDIYDYTAESLLNPGSVVIVTLRGQKIRGVVLGDAEGKFKINRLLSIVDIQQGFSVSAATVAFFQWMRKRYGVGYGVLFRSLFSFLPRIINSDGIENPFLIAARNENQNENLWELASSPNDSIAFIKEFVHKHPQSQLLVLFPNIALLEQSAAALAALGPYIVHSNVTKQKLLEIGSIIAGGGNALVFSTRIGLFLPWMKLGGVVMMYENNEDHKPLESTPRYHTRDAACELARCTGATFQTFGSAPSLTLWYTMRSQHHYSMTQLPHYQSLEIIDMRARPYEQRFLSHESLLEILETLKNQESVLLIHERRGVITTLRCSSCFTLLRCRICNSALLAKQKILLCPECKSNQPLPVRCDQCARSTFLRQPAGIERIRPELLQELKKQFPSRTPEIHIWSKDQQLSVTSWQLPVVLLATSYAFDRMKILADEGPRVRLVVVLSVDGILSRGEFDSAEAIFSRLTQLASDATTFGIRTIIQSRFSEHHVFQAISQNNPQLFYEHELKERTRFGFPPAFLRLTVQPRKPIPAFQKFVDRIAAGMEYRKTKGAVVIRCPTNEQSRIIAIQSALLDRFPGKLKVALV